MQPHNYDAPTDEYNPDGIAMTRQAYLKQAMAVEFAKGSDADWNKYNAFKEELGPLAIQEARGNPDRLYHAVESELAKDETDYEFVALLYNELDSMNLPHERPKSTKEIERPKKRWLGTTLSVLGVAMFIIVLVTGTTSPPLLVLTAALMGLPTMLRATFGSETALWLILLASAGFGTYTMMDASQSQAQALRRAHMASCHQINAIRIEQNRLRRHVDLPRLPLIDCHLQVP